METVGVHKGRERMLENENRGLQELLESFEKGGGTSGGTSGASDGRSDGPTVLALRQTTARLEEELAFMTQRSEKYDATVEKFHKLKDALGAAKGRAAKAEERAAKAENLAGRGQYNSDTTRILHLKENPRAAAVGARHEGEMEEERERGDRLEAELAAVRGGGGGGGGFGGEGGTTDSFAVSSVSTPLKTPSRTPSKGAAVDYEKVNLRLKQQFSKTTAVFRESVCGLFGYRVDMEGLEKGKTQFKLRSMFAESEGDCLLFKQNADGRLDLCETPFAKGLGADATMYLTTAKSVPAFLSHVTLSLFDQQTFMG